MGSRCYCDASAVVANCFGCVERFLKILADASAPGWASRRKGLVSGKRIVLRKLAPGPTPFSPPAGSVLGCAFGLQSQERVGASVEGHVFAAKPSAHLVANSTEPAVLSAGDVLLLQPERIAKSYWQGGRVAAGVLFVLEVWL
eukprot:TRINITY_DN42763_c0_g1_i1.p2 TRINITY_DN42763_c0_g1~~TRINITY_DN42763_c0_g1_i1.p2  ORF type:complete len:161 (-),score=28.33 TRINITY_DN42763_c0_g1_i1:165-593(-)